MPRKQTPMPSPLWSVYVAILPVGVCVYEWMCVCVLREFMYQGGIVVLFIRKQGTLDGGTLTLPAYFRESHRGVF